MGGTTYFGHSATGHGRTCDSRAPAGALQRVGDAGDVDRADGDHRVEQREQGPQIRQGSGALQGNEDFVRDKNPENIRAFERTFEQGHD